MGGKNIIGYEFLKKSLMIMQWTSKYKLYNAVLTVWCRQSFNFASYAAANYVICYIMLSLSLP